MKEKTKETTAHYVAIIGKPNVGKSTLFNFFVGRRKSIVEEHSGTTRDRLYERLSIADKDFFIIDTGGVKYDNASTIDQLVDQEVNKAIIESCVLIFVCDNKGLSALDYQLAEDLRLREKEVILVVNKVDEPHQEGDMNEYFKLGFGEPVYISAMHGRNIELLQDTVYARLPNECYIPEQTAEFSLAVVGEPNAGKSTFLNQLLQNARSVVSEIPGTTRDSVEAYVRIEDRTIKIIDTAGIKKKKKLKTPAALFSLFRAKKSIEHADITLLLIDAFKGPQKDTRLIYNALMTQHKGCVIGVNKWDTVNNMPMQDYHKRLITQFGFLKHVPMVFISAQNGRNVTKCMQEVVRVWECHKQTIMTRALHAFLDSIRRTRTFPPPVKLKHMVQVRTHPPTFVIVGRHINHLEENHKQYILNELMRYFSLAGIYPKLYIKEDAHD